MWLYFIDSVLSPHNIVGIIGLKMNTSPKKIALQGAYGSGNFGDDMLMLAAYEIIYKVFDSKCIVFICSNSNYIQKIIPHTKLIPAATCKQNADIIIYGGGTQFYSFPLTTYQRNISSFLRRILNIMKNPDRLWQKVIQEINQVFFPITKLRVAAIGIGLGPFVEDCSYLPRTKEIIKNMNYIAVRDVYSYDLCKNWGVDNLYFRSDLCYLPSLWKEYMPDLNINNTLNEIKRVGVIIRDWPHTHEGDSYAVPLFKIIDELRLAGKEVEFILFAERSDKQWAIRLKDRKECVISWSPEHDSISSFLKKLSTYDVFITARYHGAVFASLLGKPVVCIEVEQKLRLVADLFGDGARLWSYPFNTSDCLGHISDLETTYSHSVECLAQLVEGQGALVEKLVIELRNSILVE